MTSVQHNAMPGSEGLPVDPWRPPAEVPVTIYRPSRGWMSPDLGQLCRAQFVDRLVDLFLGGYGCVHWLPFLPGHSLIISTERPVVKQRTVGGDFLVSGSAWMTRLLTSFTAESSC